MPAHRPILISRLPGRTRSASWLLVAAVSVALAAGAGYASLFSSFAPYDDEGYVMISLRSYLAGRPLYDETFSQYGPAYYTLQGGLHRTFGWEISHAVTRYKTLVAWLAAAALSSAVVFRLTQAKWVTAAAFPAVFFYLDRLGFEPGHPQELCALLVLGTLFAATFVRPHVSACGPAAQPRLPVLVMGLLAGTAVMTKVNVGAYLCMSLSLAMLTVTKPARLATILLVGAVLFALLLPLLVVHAHLTCWPVLQLLSVVLCGLCAALRWARGPRGSGTIIGWGSWIWFVAAVLASCTAYVALALLQGTSPAGLWEGVLLQHQRFVREFFQPPPIPAAALVAAPISLFVAFRVWQGNRPLERAARYLLLILPVCLALRQWSESFHLPMHGSEDRSLAALLTSFFTPLAWLLLANPTVARTRDRHSTCDLPDFGRSALLLVASLQPLTMYPVPGTQVAVGSLALLLALLAVTHDSLALRDRIPRPGVMFRLRPEAVYRTGILILLLATLASRAVFAGALYARLQPLGLPGSQHLRLESEEVAQRRWVTGQLRAHGDTFICLPMGYNSYYFWTRLEPPTSLNTTVWPELLSSRQQRVVVAAIESHPRVCVLVDRSLPLPDPRKSPLARFLFEQFELRSQRLDTEIWTRRGSGLAARADSS